MRTTAQAVTAGLAGTLVSVTFLTQGFTWPFYILTAPIAAVGAYADTLDAKGSGRL